LTTRLNPAAGTSPLSRLQLAGIAGGAALVPLNSTMIAVALPRIADDFDITVGRASLLVTVYLVAMLVGQPLAGRLGDVVGHRRIVRVALVGFAAMSVAGAVAPSFAILVAARVGQAAFGAAIGPGVQSVLRTVTQPQDRGRTFGFFGSIIGIGAAAGPVVGGALTQAFGWPAIMLVNLPIVVWALIAAPAEPGRSTSTAEARVAAGPSWWNRVFLACFALQALTTVGQYMLLLITPVILEARGWSSAPIGLILSTLTLGLIVMGPVGGRSGDLRGRRWPVAIGVAVTMVAIAVSALAGPSLHVAALLAVLTASGLGLGFAIPSVMTSALESVDERRTGAASGVLSMSRYVGSISTSLLVSAWISDDGGGVGRALWVATAASAVGLLCAALLPSRSAAEPAVRAAGT
jgi:MFS family permease